MMQSCSGSNLGKKLADSFENPIETDKVSSTVQSVKAKDTYSDEKISKQVELKVKDSLSETRSKQNIISTDNQLKLASKKNLKFTPKTYRVIVKLPGENPSAPAEAVIRALRNAGVIFEIEKIERIDKKYFKKSL